MLSISSIAEGSDAVPNCCFSPVLLGSILIIKKSKKSIKTHARETS
jgi:hypothetical protein